MIIQHGLRLVDAVRASPIFLFEIIVVAISGYYLANEILTLKDFFGGLFIIVKRVVNTNNNYSKTSICHLNIIVEDIASPHDAVLGKSSRLE